MPNHELLKEQSDKELLISLLGETNDLESLSPSEITYADIQPYLPPGKGLKVSPSPLEIAPANSGAQLFNDKRTDC